MRLDRFLAEQQLALTRSQLKNLIDQGMVLVNGAAVKAGHQLCAGDEIQLTLAPPTPSRAVAQDIPIDVLFEDEHLVVVDKPAGLVVHPAPGHPDGTLVNALLHRCSGLSGIGGQLRPGIVHRLDKDTSGVMVVSKNDATHHALAALFSDKKEQLVREYIAVVAPGPQAQEGTFSTLHGRHPVNRKKFSSRVQRGKSAVTHYRVEERLGEQAAVVRCILETGRTHQIRVHFADAGSPLVGDVLYGGKAKSPLLRSVGAQLGRQALHAARLGFVHPATAMPLSFETVLPADMLQLVAALRVVQQK